MRCRTILVLASSLVNQLSKSLSQLLGQLFVRVTFNSGQEVSG